MQNLKGSKEELKRINHKKTKRKIRRNNANLYPIYKMFSWDLLCYYPIQFLFFTLTKEIDASQILVINAIYLIFKMLTEIPAVAIVDLSGHKKSLIIGNSMVFISMLVLLFVPGLLSAIISEIIFAFGYNIKTISESNLLYESVSTRGGEGLYTKIESKGGSWYYYLDGVLGLASGFLFVINHYIPVIICTVFTLVSTILSFKFENVHKKKSHEKESLKNILAEYNSNLKESIKFLIKSKRMRSYIIFGAVFYGLIKLITIYKSEMILQKGIAEQEYAMILAIATILSGVAVSYSRKIHKKLRNKTLTVLSLTFVFFTLMAATVGIICTNDIAIPAIILACVVFKIIESLWYIYEYKYLKNFTNEKIRNKIMFTYEGIGSIAASLVSIVGGFILNIMDINYACILMGLLFLIGIILSLDYMRTRFGLRPNQYKKEDIEF